MLNEIRPSYEIKAELLARLAERLGKAPEELVPWVDYDPISVDEEAYHLSMGHGAVRWTGD